MEQTVYVSSPNSQEIYVWRLDQFKLKLELMQVVQTIGNAQPITIHPNQQFLYTGIRPNFSIITYAINQEGLLKKIKINTIMYSPTYLTINKKGTFLYYASYNYNSVNVMPINTSGILDDSIQDIQNLSGCHSVNFDNRNNLLWITCLKEHSLRMFNVHETGLLTPLEKNHIIINLNSSPRHITFHNYENYAYVINELHGTIHVIRYLLINKIQSTNIIQTICILPKYTLQRFWSSDIHITPNCHWLYCTDRLFNIISCFQVLSENKKLKFVYYQYTETQPRGFAIDKTGHFLITAGQKSNYISLYSINSNNGKLDLISRYESGQGPVWVYIRGIKNV